MFLSEWNVLLGKQKQSIQLITTTKKTAKRDCMGKRETKIQEKNAHCLLWLWLNDTLSHTGLSRPRIFSTDWEVNICPNSFSFDMRHHSSVWLNCQVPNIIRDLVVIPATEAVPVKEAHFKIPYQLPCHVPRTLEMQVSGLFEINSLI